MRAALGIFVAVGLLLLAVGVVAGVLRDLARLARAEAQVEVLEAVAVAHGDRLAALEELHR